MMVPVGRLTVLAKAAKSDMMRMVAYIVWPGLVAPVIAPLAGGLITTYTSWRWLFLINIPLGIAAFAVAVRLVPGHGRDEHPPRLDWAGVVLTCTGLAGLTWSAHLLSEPAAALPPALAIGAGSVILLAATARHLLRASHPLVDLAALRVRSLRMSIGGGSLFMLMIGAVPFLLPLLFQNIFGWSPVRSGAVVLFVFVGNIGIKPATTFLLNRFGFRTILIAATVGAAATMVGAGFFTGGTPLAIIIVVTLLSGVARSVGFTAYTTLAFSDIPEAQMRDANTLAATSQQLSIGLGVAVATVALRAGLPVGRLLTSHPTQATAYSVAFFVLALIALAATRRAPAAP